MKPNKKQYPTEVVLLSVALVIMSVYAIYKLGYETGVLYAMLES